MAIYTAAAAMAIAEEMMGIATGTGLGTTACSGLAAKYAAPCRKKYPAYYANTNSNILNNLNSEEYLNDEERKNFQKELRASKKNGFDELDKMLKKSKNQEDISNLSNLSLFKQISFRYYKSLDKVLIRAKNLKLCQSRKRKQTILLNQV